VLAQLTIHVEQRDAALAALRITIAANTPTDEFVPLKVAAKVAVKVAAGQTRFNAETIRLWASKEPDQSEPRGGR
jgi:hypothetical protein